MKLQYVRTFIVSVLFFSVMAVPSLSLGGGFLSFGNVLKGNLKKGTSVVTGSAARKKEAKARQSISADDASIENRNITYAGYSERFLTVKKLLVAGKAGEAYELQEKILKESKHKPNLLFYLEQATIAMDADMLSEARGYLDDSERLVQARHRGTVVGDKLKGLGVELYKAAGKSEFGPYAGESYELILMLNLKSIAYMLDGNRKAYNVTRRAIDWQNMEKKVFDKKMEKVKEKLKEEEQVQSKKGNDVGSLNLFRVIQDQYKSSKSKALQVPSAFVNPFGFYMAGIVQEFDSYEDPSLRDNARISYKKALELNPKSKIIRQSLEDIQKSAPKGKRLVQIVVGDGFAPEKKVLRFDYILNGANVPIKLLTYEPDESTVARIEVLDAKGKKLATLSNVADIDAISLRHQYDSLPEQHLRVSIAIVRSVFMNEIYKNFGGLGAMLKKKIEKKVNPDTRAWMSLPKRFLAARLYLHKNVKGLRLVSYDKNGRVLSDKKMNIETGRHNFVYARTLNRTMYINQNKELWVKLR